MKILQALGIRRARLSSIESFAGFQGEQAAFVTQKLAYGYCRARVGRAREQIMFDSLFNQAMEPCRWDGFAAMLGCMMLWAEQRLRQEAEMAARALGQPAGAGGLGLAEGLCCLYDRILDSHPVPAHRPDWSADKAVVAERLAAARTAPESDLMTTFAPAWAVIFPLLPLDDRYKKLDHDQVLGTLRLWLVQYVEAFDHRVERAAVAAALIGLGADGDGTRVAA